MTKKERALARAADYLRDETITASVAGTIEITVDGRDSLEWGLLVTTEDRVVFFVVSITGPRLLTFHYHAIRDVAVARGVIGNEIRFTTDGRQVLVKWIEDPELTALTDVLTLRTNGLSPSLVSITEQAPVIARSA